MDLRTLKIVEGGTTTLLFVRSIVTVRFIQDKQSLLMSDAEFKLDNGEIVKARFTEFEKADLLKMLIMP